MPYNPGGPHVGPNNLQNYPIVQAITTAGGSTTISGLVNSTPGHTFLIQVFADNGNGSGNAEGRFFLGQASVTTSSTGVASFTVIYNGALPASAVTATATDLSTGDTSEFSPNVVVTNTNDTGFGSLRQAITTVNSLSISGVAIGFNIPGPGVQTIQPVNQLPTILEPILIDGYSQPGSSPNTLAVGDNAVILIDLDGSLLGGQTGPSAVGLFVASDNVTIQGLAMGNFASDAIEAQVRSGLVIQGNFIGTNASGTTAAPNGIGVYFPVVTNSTIGGITPAARNLISGNGNGIFLDTIGPSMSAGILVVGNEIGTNAAGTAAIGNTGDGVVFFGAANSTIGGTTSGAGNVISGNQGAGVSITGRRTRFLAIGSEHPRTESSALGNLGDGVDLNAGALQ